MDNPQHTFCVTSCERISKAMPWPLLFYDPSCLNSTVPVHFYQLFLFGAGQTSLSFLKSRHGSEWQGWADFVWWQWCYIQNHSSSPVAEALRQSQAHLPNHFFLVSSLPKTSRSPTNKKGSNWLEHFQIAAEAYLNPRSRHSLGSIWYFGDKAKIKNLGQILYAYLGKGVVWIGVKMRPIC